MTQTTLAHRLALYADRLTYDQIPAPVRHGVKRRLIDSLGTALAAQAAEPVRIARAVALEQGGRPVATLWGSTDRVPPDLAGFVNGLALRYLDWNDTYLSLEPAHPSDNLAAVLAAAEAAGRSGRDVIVAAALAYEIQCRLCDAASLRQRGWDHVCYGLVSTALAAGKLLGLDAFRLEQAVGLAVTPHLAMRQTRAGELSMWKGAAFANAARNGLFAALLAAHGMTGPAPVFEGTFGLFNQVTGRFDLDRMGGAGDDFILPYTYLKHFPVEYHAQAAVEIALELHAGWLKAADVDRVTIETFKTGLEIIAGDPEKWAPRTRETADHSLPYCFDVALLDGRMTPEQFTTQRILAPDVRDLLARTEVVEDPVLTAKYPDGIPTRVVVSLRSGGTLERRRDYALGHPRNPMSDAQVEGKFRALVGDRLPPAQAGRLLEAVWQLEKIDDLGALLRFTAPE